MGQTKTSASVFPSLNVFFSRILAVVSRRRQAAAMSESTNPAHVPKSNRAEFKRFRRAGERECLAPSPKVESLSH
jgi:hypothetical protein